MSLALRPQSLLANAFLFSFLIFFSFFPLSVLSLGHLFWVTCNQASSCRIHLASFQSFDRGPAAAIVLSLHCRIRKQSTFGFPFHSADSSLCLFFFFFHHFLFLRLSFSSRPLCLDAAPTLCSLPPTRYIFYDITIADVLIPLLRYPLLSPFQCRKLGRPQQGYPKHDSTRTPIALSLRPHLLPTRAFKNCQIRTSTIQSPSHPCSNFIVEFPRVAAGQPEARLSTLLPWIPRGRWLHFSCKSTWRPRPGPMSCFFLRPTPVQLSIIPHGLDSKNLIQKLHPSHVATLPTKNAPSNTCLLRHFLVIHRTNMACPFARTHACSRHICSRPNNSLASMPNTTLVIKLLQLVHLCLPAPV